MHILSKINGKDLENIKINKKKKKKKKRRIRTQNSFSRSPSRSNGILTKAGH